MTFSCLGALASEMGANQAGTQIKYWHNLAAVASNAND